MKMPSAFAWSTAPRANFTAITAEPQTNVRNAGGINPLTLHPSTGKRVDIIIPVEEGDRYRLGGITFSGNKAYPNNVALRHLFALKDGDWFNAQLFGKGLEALRKAYGEGGFINMVGTPTPSVDRAKHIVSLKPIPISTKARSSTSPAWSSAATLLRATRSSAAKCSSKRKARSTTSRLVDLSLLRLNQLQYFRTRSRPSRTLKRARTLDADPQYGTVDLLVKLKEKGKNSIGLNGGISGNSGTFIGANYETNNFLGLGETLSANANISDLARNLSFGFNEPYLHNKPISLGIQVFDSKSDFNPAKAYAIANNTSANLTNAQQSQLTQYNQSSKGLTVSTSTALRNLFRRSGVARMGLSYGLPRSGIATFNQNTLNVFTALAFRSGIAGQNQLQGIVTSVLTPSFSFSTLDRAQGPHHGKDFNIAFQFAGLGGNTKYYSPNVSYRQFFPMKWA